MIYSIYKILCDDLSDFNYVGSTQAFRNRKCQHKSRCNNEKDNAYNRKLYTTIRDNGGWENWRMVCVEEIELESKRQAEAKEEEWRMKLNGNLNSKRCYITEEQKKEEHRDNSVKYYYNNQEAKKAYSKTHRDNNQEKIKEWKNTKCECACGGRYTTNNKAIHEKSIKHKNYIENNKN